MQSNNNNKFLKIHQSENCEYWQPAKISQHINKKQFIYIDFADQKQKLSIMKASDPNEVDSDEQAQMLGESYVAGLNKLSPNTYNIIKYLSQNRIQNQKIQRIDDMVRKRVAAFQSKKSNQQMRRRNLSSITSMKQQSASPHNKKVATRSISQMYNYNPNKLMPNKSFQEEKSKFSESLTGEQAPKRYINSKEQKLMDSDRIGEYLEKISYQRLKEKLRAQENGLQKSISSAREFKKIQSRSLDYKINNKSIKLPSINSRNNKFG